MSDIERARESRPDRRRANSEDAARRPGEAPFVERLVGLQHAVGNRAVTAMLGSLQRQPTDAPETAEAQTGEDFLVAKTFKRVVGQAPLYSENGPLQPIGSLANNTDVEEVGIEDVNIMVPMPSLFNGPPVIMPMTRKFARVRIISSGQRGRVDSMQLGGAIGVSESDKGKPLAFIPSSDQGLLTLRSGVGGVLPVEDTTSLLDLGGQMLTDLFAIDYTGPASSQTHLLQFVWREVLGYNDNDLFPKPVAGPITTTGGSYELTTSVPPAEGNYNTDAAPGSPTPYYEGAGVNTRTAEATTIYDLPYNAIDKVQAAFKNGAKRVVSRAHFITFAVRWAPGLVMFKDLTITAVVALRVEWEFNSANDDPKRKVTTLGEVAPPNGVLGPTPLRSRFRAQYPAWEMRMFP